MIKQDEKKLWKTIWEIKNQKKHPYFREIAQQLNIPGKRAFYICTKWSNKGLINSGVNVLAGWIEENIIEEDLK